MSIALRISEFNRRRKWQLFMDWAAPTAQTRILDVGFCDEEYSPADNFLEKHYPWRRQVVALGVDEPKHFRKNYPDVEVVLYDGKIFPFADVSFDVAFSNAVLEHVGTPDDQVRFIQELCRVSKKVFFTTPNRSFPIEMHTRLPIVHWFPDRLRNFFFRMAGKSWATGEYMQLLTVRTLKKRLEHAGISNYTIHRNRLCGLTLDVVVMIECHSPSHN